MISQTISHYKIIEKLGEGGMGVVYKAQDIQLDRTVALKFLPAHASVNAETNARFLQEAKAAAALNHNNICTIYGVDESDGRMFIAMEYIEGGTLREKLPFSRIDDAVTIAIQIGEALQEAHSKGIVHRDVKADNIMLTSKGQAKVMDFGLAKLKGSLKLTKTSSTVGTLGYMAPEQIQGGEVDYRSDVFSFGVLLFEMLTGKLPFRGEHEAAMVYSIVHEQPEPLTNHLPGAHPELSLLISKALEKDPADRYQAVSEMLVDLRRLRKKTTHVSRQYMAYSAAGETAVPPSKIEDAHGLARDGIAAKRSKALWYIGAALLAIAVLAILFVTLKDHRVMLSAANVKMTRLTSAGNAGYATISPDGKYVVYAKGDPGEVSLWIRQIASSTDVMVIPASGISIHGSTFSNDGNYVYFTASSPEFPVPTVYRTPVIGGAPPRKIIENVSGSVSLSPDDSRLAFFRVYPSTGEEALFIANADGSGERKLSSRDGKNLFYTSEGGAPAWSPDGSVIACPAGSAVGFFSVSIIVISVDDPRERPITKSTWDDVGRLAWYPDGSGLIACTQAIGEPTQISYISYPGGEVTRITNDILDYGPTSLSITKDASAIVSAQTQRNSTVIVAQAGRATEVRDITRGATRSDGVGGMMWVGNRDIVYTSWTGETVNLWISGLEGSAGKQITFGTAGNYSPAPDLVRGEIYYVSRDSNLAHIWKMKNDGSNPVQVSFSEDYNPDVSADGTWLMFDSWKSGARSIWKMKIGTQDTATLFRSGASEPKISPNGRLVACRFHDEKERRERMAVLRFSDATIVSVFDFPQTANDNDYQWTPDGNSIHFVDTKKGISNIWVYDLTRGKMQPVTTFTSGRIFTFAWSPDGKNLAVAHGQSNSDLVLLTISK